MEIQYKDKKIREVCEKRVVAEKKLGALSAKKLLLRLQALEAAKRVTDLVAGNPHPLKVDRAGQFALDLHDGCRLVFAPSNNPKPTTEDGAIDWSQVTIVCIEFIGDYHD